jgi:hypothetical protein
MFNSRAVFESSERLRDFFVTAFRAIEITEPLPSFDSGSDAGIFRQCMEQMGCPVAGVRRAGLVAGYVLTEDVQHGVTNVTERFFSPDDVVSGDSPLKDIIANLTKKSLLFVTTLEQITGFIVPSCIQKPPGRMWLFGIVTLIEQRLTAAVTALFPNNKWHSLVSHGRMAKAQQLYEERLRRKQSCRLIDCLQLSDKADIIGHDARILDCLQFGSRREFIKMFKQFESLRNNLAHGQDIVTNDWLAIVMLASEIENITIRPRLKSLLLL